MKRKYPLHWFPVRTLFGLCGLIAANSSLVQAEDDAAASIARGKTVFLTCAACHGPDGKGLPTNPPMAPSLVGSKLATGPAEVPVAIVLKGIQKNDTKYLGMMTPLGPALSDQQLADVLTYIRGSFGNKASAIAVKDVAKWREKYKEITAPLPREAFEKKSEKLAAEEKAASPAPATTATPTPAPATTAK